MKKPKYTLGPDIDLDNEVVLLADGTRMTETIAETLADEVLAARRGRPSVTGRRERTPSLTVRVEPEVRQSLERIAAARGTKLADITRDALRLGIEALNKSA